MAAAVWTLGACSEESLNPQADLKSGATRWHFSNAWGFGSPGVDSAAAYFPGFGHEVWALRKADGALRWKVVLPVARPNHFGQGLVVGKDHVIVGDEDVFSLDPATGHVLWRFTPSDGRNPGLFLPTLADGIVYCGSSSGHVYALSESTGQLIWQTKVVSRDSVSIYSPVVSGDALGIAFTDFVLSDNNEPLGGVAVLDRPTGAVRWVQYLPPTLSPDAPTAATGAAIAGGVIAAESRDGPVHAFDVATGIHRWSAPGLLDRDMRPIVTDGTMLVVGSNAKRLVALDPADGRQVWQLSTPLGSTGSLRLTDGELVFLYAGGQVMSVDPRTGNVRWSRDDVRGTYPPAIDDESIFVGGSAGLWALAR
jgi:outer membrane protein assembly factor BamB